MRTENNTALPPVKPVLSPKRHRTILTAVCLSESPLSSIALVDALIDEGATGPRGVSISLRELCPILGVDKRTIARWIDGLTSAGVLTTIDPVVETNEPRQFFLHPPEPCPRDLEEWGIWALARAQGELRPEIAVLRHRRIRGAAA